MTRDSDGRAGIPMSMRRVIRIAGMLLGIVALPAQVQLNFGPPGSVAFGTGVTWLPNGNLVATDPQGVTPNVVRAFARAFGTPIIR